jgi:hypothetical protein
MKEVFVAFLYFGTYEDKVKRPLRAFATRAEAAEFCQRETRRIAINVGILTSINKLMADYFPLKGKSTEDESQRLKEVLGFDDTNYPDFDEETFMILVEEVPFG